MKVPCALLLALLVHGAPAADISLRISGGKMALPGQFPYQALVRRVDATTGVPDDQTLCAGALIDPSWVLTAASCVVYPEDNYEVTFGAFDLTVSTEETRISYSIQSKSVHEAYNAETGENDIALVKLAVAVEEDEFIAPIRLPSAKQTKDSFWLWKGSVSGWGFTSKDDKKQGNWVLRWFDSRVQPNFWCKLFHGSKNVRDSTLCLGGIFWKKGTCLGDAGNPVAITEWDGKATLIAIASNDAKACGNFKPPVFTRVTSYLEWISKTANIALR